MCLIHFVGIRSFEESRIVNNIVQAFDFKFELDLPFKLVFGLNLVLDQGLESVSLVHAAGQEAYCRLPDMVR